MRRFVLQYQNSYDFVVSYHQGDLEDLFDATGPADSTFRSICDLSWNFARVKISRFKELNDQVPHPAQFLFF